MGPTGLLQSLAGQVVSTVGEQRLFVEMCARQPRQEELAKRRARTQMRRRSPGRRAMRGFTRGGLDVQRGKMFQRQVASPKQSPEKRYHLTCRSQPRRLATFFYCMRNVGQARGGTTGSGARGSRQFWEV